MNKIIPTVSLCMIVRDEENNLEACIDAVKPLIDEVIIVDTGSKDSTIEIAKRKGAKVFNFAWKDNFSAARNFAIQQASCDWILNLDADHVFNCINSMELKNKLKDTSHYAFLFEECSNKENGNQQFLERLILFKNKCGFKFRGIIHESPLKSIIDYAKSNKIKMPIGKFDSCKIDHIDCEKYVEKLKRNLPILKNAIAREPDNFHYRFRLLLTYRNLRLFKEYDELLLNTIYKLEKQKPALTESIVGIWGQFGDWVIKDSNADDVEKFYDTAGTINEKTKWNDIRLVWPYVKISIFQKKYDKAIEDLKKCIQNGIAPKHVALSVEERITPVHQLLKLVNDFKSGKDFIRIILELENLLKGTGLKVKRVLGTIYENDQTLYNAIKEVTGNELVFDESSPGITNIEKPGLSLCMIIKNEEETLERCLRSAADIVDEIIIVDTGSTDNSIKIAENYGALIIKYDWKNNFAKARNYALQSAKSDWILQLDADEELLLSAKRQLINEITDTSADGINVIIRNYQPKGETLNYLDEQQVRLFRNKPEYRFRNRIHEQIIPSIADAGGIFSESEIIINHYGYQTENTARTKRNLSLLNKELKVNPEDPHILFKLGETYKALKKWDKAADYLTQALAHSSLTNEIKELIYLRLGQIGLAKNNYEVAKKYAQACLRFNGKNAMAKYILGVAMMYLKETKDALVLFSELRSTQQLHGLNLNEVDNLLDAMAFSETDEVLN